MTSILTNQAAISALQALAAIKAKIVAAFEEGVDRQKIQTEIEQLKDQIVSSRRPRRSTA